MLGLLDVHHPTPFTPQTRHLDTDKTKTEVLSDSTDRLIVKADTRHAVDLRQIDRRTA